jgi:glucosamine-6-phosphate isomerase
MVVYKVHDEEMLGQIAADIFSAQILSRPDSVLGFATGSTPLGLYAKLVEKNKAGLIDFSRITTFNLDEYCGLPRENPQSYYSFMHDHLFSHINVQKENVHLPDGMAADVSAECERYESKIDAAGGIDLQILGIGANGHIGFNEPGAVFYDRTHCEELKESTREANKRFFNSIDEVPTHAISMGVGTIMRARKIVLLGSRGKKDIIEKMLYGDIDPQVPASIVRFHPDVTVAYIAE